MRCSAGRPTGDRGCLPCRDSTSGCRDAGRPCIEVPLSMADPAPARVVPPHLTRPTPFRPSRTSSDDDRRRPLDEATDAGHRGRRDRGAPSACQPVRRAVVDRLPQLSVTIVGGLAAVHEFPAVRLVVRGDRGVRAAGVGADPRHHNARGRIRVRLAVRAGLLPAVAAVDQRAGRGAAVDCPVHRARRCFPACSVCSPSRVGGCPAGRSGSRGCGRRRNGSSRRCRSADSLGA